MNKRMNTWYFCIGCIENDKHLLNKPLTIVMQEEFSRKNTIESMVLSRDQEEAGFPLQLDFLFLGVKFCN